MKTFGCIDNPLGLQIYNDFIDDIALTPYLKDKKHYYDHIDNYRRLNWFCGFDNGFYKSDEVIQDGQTSVNFWMDKTKDRFFLGFFKSILSTHFKHLDIGEVSRIRVNLSPNIPTEKWLYPHVDQKDNHISMTLLIGESEGDHIVFNDKSLSIAARYSHKDNRLVWNMNHFHTSINPTDNCWRLSINALYHVE